LGVQNGAELEGTEERVIHAGGMARAVDAGDNHAKVEGRHDEAAGWRGEADGESHLVGVGAGDAVRDGRMRRCWLCGRRHRA
jgi:hypothetical protein